MPDALVAALVEPIREVQALVGSGAVAADIADALQGASTTLQDVSLAVGREWGRAAERWSGSGADAAAGNLAATVAEVEATAARVGDIGSSTGAAGAAIARAHRRLSDIVDAFETRAAALEPHLDSPAVTAELLAEARRSLAEAVRVVDELRSELEVQAAALPPAAAATATTPAGMMPAATTPAAFTPPIGSGPGGAASGFGMPTAAGPGSASGGGLGSLIRNAVDLAQVPVDTPDAASFGEGVAVRLPDGSTAMAPNALAASAVRHALTQLGVPYDWGGTTPGVGLDCSGLTQWAYAEAGLPLPRLAQEQDVGAAVDAGSLRPGDLAVWDGHVAMIVGNGQMIEAGDPVQLSPIRTTNAGQGFQGFWRPSA